MALTFGLRTSRDLFEKLKRDAALLDEEITSDRFFNFVVTGYSLIDWLKHEPSVPIANVQSMYNDHWIRICGDLATASKHFVLSNRRPIISDAKSQQGWGVGRWGKGGYGVGEEYIQITLNDGSSFSGIELIKNVINTWENFFSSHGI